MGFFKVLPTFMFWNVLCFLSWVENYWSFTYFYFHEICMFSILMLFYDVVKTEIRLLIQKLFQSVIVSYLWLLKAKRKLKFQQFLDILNHFIQCALPAHHCWYIEPRNREKSLRLIWQSFHVYLMNELQKHQKKIFFTVAFWENPHYPFWDLRSEI